MSNGAVSHNSVSKLFGLTEGVHLPSMGRYLRWVQFREDDPLVQDYINNGYPYRKLVQYSGTIIIGFPTEPAIVNELPEFKLVTAGEATPEEQFQWLMLLEKYWILGVEEDGTPSKENAGNQISYTLKYDPKLVSYEHFREMVLKYQKKVKAVAVMPQSDVSAYEYQPEQAVTKAEFEAVANAIKKNMEEDIGKEHLDCKSAGSALAGGCPIDFNEVKAA